MNNFAANLRKLRTAIGYSQKQMSEQLHISSQSYSNYEKGSRTPSMEVAGQIADFFQISLDILIYGVIDESDKTIRQHTPLSLELATLLTEYGQLSSKDKREIRALIKIKLLA